MLPLRAEGPLAICAAVGMRLIPWVSFVLIALLDVPFPWVEIIAMTLP